MLVHAHAISRAGHYFADPRWAVPERFIAAIGIPVDEAGTNHGENLTLACRNAVLNMIELLRERGFSREQAYVICSVVADLREQRGRRRQRRRVGAPADRGGLAADVGESRVRELGGAAADDLTQRTTILVVGDEGYI